MEPDVHSTVQRLARHLRLNPNVCDTCEGIVRWWLADGTPPVLVEAALAWMEACGVVESAHAADGRTRFRRATAPGPGLAQRLQALEDDPRSLLPPPTAGAPRGVLH
ncbi:MAG: hypothetical protein JWQ76_1344 [Ramlibacter sp.]|nr:hypothetical protein [Ramlibacter sp.]